MDGCNYRRHTHPSSCVDELSNAEKSDGDIVAIHEDVAGKFIGGLLSTFFTVYAAFLALTVLRTYIEVIQVWMFPHINTWGISIILVVVVYYFVSGGFRIVTALAFFSLILGTPLFFEILCDKRILTSITSFRYSIIL